MFDAPEMLMDLSFVDSHPERTEGRCLTGLGRVVLIIWCPTLRMACAGPAAREPLRPHDQRNHERDHCGVDEEKQQGHDDLCSSGEVHELLLKV